MKSTTKDNSRTLDQVSRYELVEAIRDMSEKLNMSGSVIGFYNIYEALFAEQEKAKEVARLRKSSRKKKD